MSADQHDTDADADEHFTDPFGANLDRLVELAGSPNVMIAIGAVQSALSASEVFDVALRHPSVDVHRFVAKDNRLTDAQIVLAAQDADRGIRTVIASRQYVPIEALRILLGDEDSYVRSTMATYCDGSLLAIAVGAGDPAVRERVVYRVDISGEELTALLGDPASWVRIRASKNSGSTLAQLDDLFRNETDAYVREAITFGGGFSGSVAAWIDAGWLPTAAAFVEAMRPDSKPSPSSSVESFMVLAEMDLTPQEAFWR